MAVYLIHFAVRYHHAGHYLGYSSDLEARIQAHRMSQGARLMEVVNEVGINWQVVRVWPEGDYELERALKARHNGPRLCPKWNPRLARSAVSEIFEPVVRFELEVVDADAFLMWLGRWAQVEVGWSDEPLRCPLGNWLQTAYGGQWQVNARSYRWREIEQQEWQEWQALPPWAVVFLDELYRQFGNVPMSGRQALGVLEWSLVEVGMWRGIW